MKRISKATILILEKTVADKKRVRKGDVISVDPSEARSLVAMGKARFYQEPIKEVKETVSKPLISVIIPFYNDHEYLNNCLWSVKNQTYTPIEIIVVDDFSKKKAEFKHAGVRYIRMHDHGGAPVARNLGAAKASGEFLFFCDADVTLHRDCIDILHNHINGFSWAYCDYLLGDDVHVYKDFSIDLMQVDNQCSSMSLIRAGDFPGFDPDLVRFQDWDLFLNMAFSGKRGVHVPMVLFEAVDRPGISQTTISNAEAKKIIKKKWGI